MTAARGHLGVALLVVTALAHEFGAVLLVQMLTYEFVHKILDLLIALSELLKALDAVLSLSTLQVKDELFLHFTDGLFWLCLGSLCRCYKRLLCLWKYGELFLSLWNRCLLNYVILYRIRFLFDI